MRLRCLLPILAVISSVPVYGEAVSGAGDPLAGRPPFRRLFLDATVVEESEGLSRVFHNPEKHPRNPIIRKDKPWEGWGPYLYGTVLRDGDRFRMWYQGVGQDGADVMYAESPDGIRWTKPSLGLHPFGDTRATNIVAPQTTHIASVIQRPEPVPASRKWAMFSFGGSMGPHVVFSPDGLRWETSSPTEQQRLFASSDVVNVFYDPYKNRYAATYKTAARRHRSVGVALSPDGLRWTKPVDGAVFTADDLDPDATQVYGMPVFPYQGLYIGLPWIYHARFTKYGLYSASRMLEAQEGSPRTVDVQLAWSWNLIHWTRTPGREPFLPLGPEGAFDSSMIYTARAPVLVDDALYFYYGGFNRIHDDAKGVEGAIGLAVLRLDGFCSMRAGSREGWLISRREVFRTPEVTINAKTKTDGYVEAEILDRNNNVVPGFSRKECVPFTGDRVRHIVRWKTSAFPPRERPQDYKIRFYLKNANLYSYLPADIDLSLDPGFRDP